MTNNDIQSWVAKYEQMWRTNAPAKLNKIFTGDVIYKESPKSRAIKGLSDLETFWSDACSRQGDFTLQSEVIAMQNNVAVVRIDVKYATDEPSQWQDIWILRFNSKGLCSSYEGYPQPAA